MYKLDRFVVMMPKRTICGKGAGLGYHLSTSSVDIESEWDFLVTVIWINIQRRIKSKIWLAQLSYSNFLTHRDKAFLLLLCALCGRQLI